MVSIVYMVVKTRLACLRFLGSEIPKIVVPDVVDVEDNDDVTLTCNLTERGSQSSTHLKRISWLKDGVVLSSVQNPDPGDPKDMPSQFKIKYANIKDGGNYTCLLQVLLRQFKEYNVAASTIVRGKKNRILLILLVVLRMVKVHFFSFMTRIIFSDNYSI